MTATKIRISAVVAALLVAGRLAWLFFEEVFRWLSST
jgi:hypothetical protein